ncbi:hypothetical protein DRQ33_07320 [bacterium]|nr:MAG: hypothetical protein DRQ33_07320 [bacterium]
MRNVIIFSLALVIAGAGVCGADSRILGPIENEYVAVQLVDSTDAYSAVGLFNIGTSSLHPVRPGEALIHAYPNTPSTSHMVFNIDGEYYQTVSKLLFNHKIKLYIFFCNYFRRFEYELRDTCKL